MSEQAQTQQSTQEEAILEVDSLSVAYETKGGDVRALRDVSLSLSTGETLGIAGESGSGKSTLALAILQYLGENGRITDGTVRFKDRDLSELSKKELRSLRGRRIAHVPQDPNTSLNPSLTVGEQIAETIRKHQDVSDKKAKERTLEIIRDVRIPDPEYNYRRYPHELSGGMQQRVLIAMALSCNPELLILDEPTTGLDVTTQAKILDLINELKDEYDTAILLITHDLGVIAQTCDRVSIVYAGDVMETGTVEEVFNDPVNPYTQGLLAALPRIEERQQLKPIEGQIPDLMDIPDGCIFADRCDFATEECTEGRIPLEAVDENDAHRTRCIHWEAAKESPTEPGTPDVEDTSETLSRSGEPLLTAENVKKYFGRETFFDKLFGGRPPVKAVDGVDVEVDEAETLGLVGESGCGKSTLGATLLRLLDIDDGTITFDGENIADLSQSDLKEFRSEAQIVFQNPHSSLNPRKRVGTAVERPLEMFTDLSEKERRERVGELLNQVNLGPEYISRWPHELSGGEKQRVAIARAFAVNPSFVVLDEPVSALDVSVQANILNLLAKLREEYDSSYLFISHDLSVVNYITDRVAVMYLGNVIEVGSKTSVFRPPYHPYTRALLSSNPSPDPDQVVERVRLEGDVPSAREPPSGCPFHTRCPQYIGEVCENEHPELEEVQMSDGESHYLACHHDEEDLADPLHVDKEELSETE